MKGWTMAGSHPADYECNRTGQTIDNNVGVRLRAVSDKAAGFGTLMQAIAPTKFLGTRVRLSGSLKGNGIDGWAGLWLRVDSQQGTPSATINADQALTIPGDLLMGLRLALRRPSASTGLILGIPESDCDRDGLGT